MKSTSYLDTENGKIYTRRDLEIFYNANRLEIEIDSGATTFSEYIGNCTNKNGFLKEIENNERI